MCFWAAAATAAPATRMVCLQRQRVNMDMLGCVCVRTFHHFLMRFTIRMFRLLLISFQREFQGLIWHGMVWYKQGKRNTSLDLAQNLNKWFGSFDSPSPSTDTWWCSGSASIRTHINHFFELFTFRYSRRRREKAVRRTTYNCGTRLYFLRQRCALCLLIVF